MTTNKATLLVARREIVERARQRAFQISTGATLAIIVIAVLIPLGGDDTTRVVVDGERAGALAQAAERAAPGLELDVEVRRAASPEAARAEVEAGDADVAAIGDPVRLIVEEELEPETGALLQQAAGDLRRAEILEGLGIEPSARQELLRPPPLAVEALAADDGGQEAQGLAVIAVLLLYGQLLIYGYWIAAGVVEEKASRIVEVLLSAIPATALLRGKLLGLGVLGFAQLLLVGVVGAGLAIATDALDVPAGAWEAVGYVLAFFVFGFAFYASLYAMAGATVQRQEDLQSSTMPLTVLVIVAFFLGMQAAQDPGGTLAQVATFVPPTAPIILPVRLITGDVAVWEVVVAVALLVLASAALIAVAVRIYRNAILRTGGKVRILDAWRAG